MSVTFLPTATKADLEAVHMAKIKPTRAQQLEQDPMAEMYHAIVGKPARIEIPLTGGPVDLRNHVRAAIRELQRAELILTEHIQNPEDVPDTRRKALDSAVCGSVGSIIRGISRMMPTRKTGKRGM